MLVAVRRRVGDTIARTSIWCDPRLRRDARVGGPLACNDLRVDGYGPQSYGDGIADVFVAINTFFNLTSAEAQARCLRRVHELLEPGGFFALEAFVPTVDRPTNRVEARTVAIDHVILTATRHDPATQTVDCQYIEIRESGIRLRPLTIRYVPPAELDAMAAAAELRLVERSSDWNGTPFAEGDVAHVS